MGESKKSFEDFVLSVLAYAVVISAIIIGIKTGYIEFFLRFFYFPWSF